MFLNFESGRIISKCMINLPKGLKEGKREFFGDVSDQMWILKKHGKKLDFTKKLDFKNVLDWDIS